MKKAKWVDRCTPAKIGTVPMVVYVHAADRRRLKPGMWARVQYHENGNWEKVLVRHVGPDGHFFADR